MSKIVSLLASAFALVGTALSILGLITVHKLMNGYQLVHPEINMSKECVEYCLPYKPTHSEDKLSKKMRDCFCSSKH